MTDGVANNLDLNALENVVMDFAELSDMYRYFRINSLRVKGYCMGNGSNSTVPENFAIYFQPNGVTSPVGGISGLEGHFATGIIGSPYYRGQAAELVLGREQLHTISPWFVTLNDTAAGADTDGPGAVQLITRNSTQLDGTHLWDVHMSVTFRSPLDPAQISAALLRRIEKCSGGSQDGKSNPSLKPEMQQAPITRVPGVVRRR